MRYVPRRNDTDQAFIQTKSPLATRFSLTCSQTQNRESGKYATQSVVLRRQQAWGLLLASDYDYDYD